MPTSNWRERTSALANWKPDIFVYSGLAAIAVLLLLFAIFRSEYPYTEKSAKAGYYQARCDDSAAAGYVALDRDIIAAKNNRKAADEYSEAEKKSDYPDYCDLAAQYRAASASEISSYGAIAGAALTFVGVMFLWLTLVYTKGALKAADGTLFQATEATREARETRRLAERQMAADLRPFAHLISAHIAEVEDGDAGFLSRGARRQTHKIIVDVKNVGRAIANYCYLSGTCSIRAFGGKVPTEVVFADIFPSEKRSERVAFIRIRDETEIIMSGSVVYQDNMRSTFVSPFNIRFRYVNNDGGASWTFERLRFEDDNVRAT